MSGSNNTMGGPNNSSSSTNNLIGSSNTFSGTSAYPKPVFSQSGNIIPQSIYPPSYNPQQSTYPQSYNPQSYNPQQSYNPNNTPYGSSSGIGTLMSGLSAMSAMSKYPSLTPYKQMLPPITNTKRLRRKQRLFHKDIENLLYALGDRPVSTDATILCLEEIMVEYLVDLSSKILSFAKSQGRSRIKMNDLAFALRNDPLKLARFQYIIEQNHRIERAKKLFEDKTGNFNEGGAGNSGRNMDDSDDDEDEHQNDADTKKKKRKVTGNVMFKN